MKYFNTVFDVFLYESIFVFFFSIALGVLNDPISDILYDISFISFIVSVVLGITGFVFNLFVKETPSEDFE